MMGDKHGPKGIGRGFQTKPSQLHNEADQAVTSSRNSLESVGDAKVAPTSKEPASAPNYGSVLFDTVNTTNQVY